MFTQPRKAKADPVS